MRDSIKLVFSILGMSLLAFFFIAGGVVLMQYLFGPTEEQRAVALVPVPISHADGCTVYRFVDGSSHYFTRCGEEVTTVRNYSESCGKGCVRHKQEEITTKGNK